MNTQISNNRNFTLGDDFTLRNDIIFSGESLQLSIDIDIISRDLQEKINMEIEKDKQHYACHVLHPEGKDWSKAGIDILRPSLEVEIRKDKQLKCVISVFYEDKVNPVFWGDIGILVDLTIYEDKLKQLMLTTLINKFF